MSTQCLLRLGFILCLFFQFIPIAFANSMEDLGFRFNGKECLNSQGEKGLNKHHFGQCANLTGIRIAGFDFSKIDFSGSDFSNSDLRMNDFTESNFSHVNLSETRLDGSNLEGVILKNTYIHKTRFNKTKLIDMEFVDVDFTGSEMKGAILDYSKFENCKMSDKDFSNIPMEGVIFSKGTELNNTNFSGVKAAQVQFLNVQAANSDFTGAFFKKSIFKKSHFAKSNFVKTTLMDSAFTDVQCQECNLTYSAFAKVNVENSIFNQSELFFFEGELLNRDMARWKRAVMYKSTKMGLNVSQAQKLGMKYITYGGTTNFYDPNAVYIGKGAYDVATIVNKILERDNVPYNNLLHDRDLKKIEYTANLIITAPLRGFSFSNMSKKMKKALRDFASNRTLIMMSSRSEDFDDFIENVLLKEFSFSYLFLFSQTDAELSKTLVSKKKFLGAQIQKIRMPFQADCFDVQRIYPEGTIHHFVYNEKPCSAIIEVPYKKGQIIFMGWNFGNAYPVGNTGLEWTKVLSHLANKTKM